MVVGINKVEVEVEVEVVFISFMLKQVVTSVELLGTNITDIDKYNLNWTIKGVRRYSKF